MGQRWSEERVWEWYDSHPWLRGCNYMSADCANRIDQWQSEGFEERFETTERELALLAETGFNTIRIILEFIVWQQEHDGFMERFDRYLDLCKKYGISCMVVLANDCMPPRVEGYVAPHLGKQNTDWGYHGGRKNSQHGRFNVMGWHVLDDEELAPQYFEMVREVVEKYKNDERIIIWDVYNEPGNSNRRPVTMKNLVRMFEIVREIGPMQPLTAATWSSDTGDNLPEVEQYCVDNSDIISYHNYYSYLTNVRIISNLKKYGRPIINTEWLARCTHNNVEEMFPLFYLEKIGCYNWGFVAGKYQTYEPWNSIWQRYEANPSLDFDFTKWFHDLYRPNHRPYNPKEIEIIKELSARADRDFEESK